MESPTEPIKLSVVIRCRNEAPALRQVFAALRAQRCAFNWEIVVVDNESTDGTAEVCAEFKARVITIKRQEFSYGRAINRGVEAARGELVMLLSAHALPVGSYFLASAAQPFDDPQIAAARCLMLGHSAQIKAWYQPKDIQYNSPEEQKLAESDEQWVSEYPAGGCCVLRRAIWQQIPYDELLESNEDKLWASQVLARGYKIRCCAEALWIYTRNYPRQQKWQRFNRQSLSLYRITGRAPLSPLNYCGRLLQTLIAVPKVVLLHLIDNLVRDTCLLTIPWQAKRHPTRGSFPEFDNKA